MKSVNKAIVIGRVGQDPEFKTLPSGDGLVNLSIATTDRWRDKNSNEMRERTDWHRVTFYRKSAEIVRDYVLKGHLLYVEGRLRNSKWQDKEGVERSRTEIEVQEFQMLTPKNSSPQAMPANSDAPARETAGSDAGPAELDDDLPF